MSDNPKDYVIILGKNDEERFRQFRTGKHKDTLKSIKDTQGAVNIWSVNSYRHLKTWSGIKSGDTVFFALNGSPFCHSGTVYSTIRSKPIAIKLWGDSPQTRSHDLLILLSSVKRIAKPFHETCRNAGITVSNMSEGIYLSQNPISDRVSKNSEKEENPGTIIIYDSSDGSPEKKSEVVTRFIRHTKKVKQLKSKYEDRCQICGHTITISVKSKYSEVHHLHPLGEGGDDDFDNMLVLCPNHHVEFDHRVTGISSDRKAVIDRKGSQVGQITMSKGHKLNMKNIKFHLEAMKKK